MITRSKSLAADAVGSTTLIFFAKLVGEPQKTNPAQCEALLVIFNFFA
jgi:hypothetical protein